MTDRKSIPTPNRLDILCQRWCSSGQPSLPFEREEYFAAIAQCRGYKRYERVTETFWWGGWWTFNKDSPEWLEYQRGCIGISCLMTGDSKIHTRIGTENCFDSLNEAKDIFEQWKKESKCKDSCPQIVAKKWKNSAYDYGFYVAKFNCFLHAQNGFISSSTTKPLISCPEHFHRDTDGWKTLYCIVCKKRDYSK